MLCAQKGSLFMFTPQQIDEISFAKAKFGGYDMASVDDFLEPLTEDYITLYKENDTLKNKMRVLVEKLEEYRKNESGMRNATANAQKTSDKMIREAEAKCTKMLEDAKAAAIQSAQNSDTMVASENARVEEAQKAAAAKISEIQEQLDACIQALELLKAGKAPAPAQVEEKAEPKKTGKASVDRPWMKFYPQEMMDHMTIPPVNLNQYLKMMCRGEELPVIHYYGTDITWKRFFNLVEETARALRAAGLGEGDQIAVMLAAVPEFLVILLAADRIGASLLCRDNTIAENAEAIEKSGAKVMFTHDYASQEEVDAYVAAGIETMITVSPWNYAIEAEMPDYVANNLEARYPEQKAKSAALKTWRKFLAEGKNYTGIVDAELDLSRPLLRAYTSGSTGTSKQVIHSAQTLIAVVHQMSAYGSSDEFRPTWLLTLLPTALIAVVVSMMLMPMASNKLLILDPYVDVMDIDLEMMRYRPNCWPCIPMFVEILMRSKRIPEDYDMSHLITFGAGCEAFNNGQVQRAQKFLNDHNCNVTFTIGYGQSEAGSNITFPCPAYPIANGNVGIPMPLNVMGIFRGEEECDYNKVGEICVAGPGLMLGYDNQETTDKTLVRHADGLLWLHTGDTGYVNEDGIFFALGRGMTKRYHEDRKKAKRLVEITMENKISDAQISGLKDSFFVTRPDADHEGYYVPYMYAVLEDGHTVDSIEQDVRDALEEHQYPVEIVQIPERPFYHFKTNRLHMEAPYAR